MGAFLLLNINGLNTESSDNTLRNMLDVFNEKKMKLNWSIEINGFQLYVFGKQKIVAENVFQIDQDNFIAGTGTFLYDCNTSTKALEKIYHDFTIEGSFLKDIRGNFALIIRKHGKFFILNDTSGLYHIFADKEERIISSSLLPIRKYLRSVSLSKQEFYEYVFTGASYGDKTVFNEIILLDSNFIYELHPHKSKHNKPKLHTVESFVNKNLDSIVERVANELMGFSGTIKCTFGNDIITPITGGFDSRLIYAALKRVGIKPDSGFVLKKDHQKDVEIASMISKNENFPLQILPNDFPDFREDTELLKEQFYLYDGLGIGGIFQYFSGLDVWKQVSYSKLLLDGGGGEIYRNIHSLPLYSLKASDYVDRVFNKKQIDNFINKYSAKNFFEILAKKALYSIGSDSEMLSVNDAQKIFPLFYLKYWMGTINSNANQFSYYLTPFSDELIVNQSLEIPARFKINGYFEAKLIRFLDEKIAKYPSNYNFNFYDGVTTKTIIAALLKSNISRSLKAKLRTIARFKKSKNNLPFYTQDSYIKKALSLDKFIREKFDIKEFEVSHLINLSEISEPAQMSRALSVELLLRNKLLCFNLF